MMTKEILIKTITELVEQVDAHEQSAQGITDYLYSLKKLTDEEWNTIEEIAAKAFSRARHR
jgi:uncharacterized protein YrzB (UPF0473 family)